MESYLGLAPHPTEIIAFHRLGQLLCYASQQVRISSGRHSRQMDGPIYGRAAFLPRSATSTGVA